MSTKLHINAQQGLLEIEGSEEFVERIYKEARGSGLFDLSIAKKPSNTNDATDENTDHDERQDSKKKRNIAKRTGPACTDRILELRSSGFLDTSRHAQEIKEGVEANGHTYASNQIGAALTSLYKRGELRRSKIDGKWKYQKP